MSSKPTVEWCLKHQMHERIPACEPDKHNTDVKDERPERAQEDNHVQGLRREVGN